MVNILCRAPAHGFDYMDKPPSDISQKLRALLMSFSDKNKEDGQKEHKFWSTQPVPQSVIEIKENGVDGPISPVPNKEDLIEPILLPSDLMWEDVDIECIAKLTEVYELLRDNYVEDLDELFRFHYTLDFLKWALIVPGKKPSWYICLRDKSSEKMVGFITATPLQLNVKGFSLEVAEVNFLCIHRDLRSKRLTPILIKEITRRINLDNVFQAIYTAGIKLPHPVSTALYFHKPLNIEKLLRCGFCSPYQQFNNELRNYSLKSLSPLEERDVDTISAKLNQYLSKFLIAPKFSLTDFTHLFRDNPGVLHSYVKKCGGVITDFVSFYSVPSSVIGKTETINVAYLFYYFSDSEESLRDLMGESLVLAKQLGYDVFNALDIMDNNHFLSPLGFAPGDGKLNYYLFNWKTVPVSSSNVGFVLF